MARETKVRHAGSGATNIATVTNLDSLAAGNIWQSGLLTNTNPGDMAVRIWFQLDWNAAPALGDQFKFYVSYGSEEATELWTGDIGESESEISVAADQDRIRATCPLVHTVTMATTTTQTNNTGHFDVFYPGPAWQILIEAVGEALAASGNSVEYRYFSPER